MELDYAFFADQAAAPDGKLYVLGGGFSTLHVPSLPTRVAVTVCAGFRFTAADSGRTHQVELRFVDAEDRLVMEPATLTFQSPPMPEGQDVEITLPTIAQLVPTIGDPGRYQAQYWYGERLLATVRLMVVERQPDVAPGAAGARPN